MRAVHLRGTHGRSNVGGFSCGTISPVFVSSTREGGTPELACLMIPISLKYARMF